MSKRNTIVRSFHELVSAQRQLMITQSAISVVAGSLVVFGAQQGEQQWPAQEIVGRIRK